VSLLVCTRGEVGAPLRGAQPLVGGAVVTGAVERAVTHLVEGPLPLQDPLRVERQAPAVRGEVGVVAEFMAKDRPRPDVGDLQRLEGVQDAVAEDQLVGDLV
jgi:hypothetical protein